MIPDLSLHPDLLFCTFLRSALNHTHDTGKHDTAQNIRTHSQTPTHDEVTTQHPSVLSAWGHHGGRGPNVRSGLPGEDFVPGHLAAGVVNLLRGKSREQAEQPADVSVPGVRGAEVPQHGKGTEPPPIGDLPEDLVQVPGSRGGRDVRVSVHPLHVGHRPGRAQLVHRDRHLLVQHLHPVQGPALELRPYLSLRGLVQDDLCAPVRIQPLQPPRAVQRGPQNAQGLLRGRAHTAHSGGPHPNSYPQLHRSAAPENAANPLADVQRRSACVCRVSVSPDHGVERRDEPVRSEGVDHTSVASDGGQHGLQEARRGGRHPALLLLAELFQPQHTGCKEGRHRGPQWAVHALLNPRAGLRHAQHTTPAAVARATRRPSGARKDALKHRLDPAGHH
eukprot:RCo005829